MPIFTSSFRTYKGPGRISIALGNRGVQAGFKVYKAAAPGYWFNKVTPEEYVRRYQDEVLSKLDPKQVHDDLYRLAGGTDPVCMCWEVLGPHECGTPLNPPFNSANWCHRRLFADWLGEALSIEIAELNVSPAP